LVQGLAQPGDRRIPLRRRRVEGEDVVVVEGDAVRTELGQLVAGLARIQRRANGLTEDVDTLPADRPQPEGELVLAGRRVVVRTCIHDWATSMYWATGHLHWAPSLGNLSRATSRSRSDSPISPGTRAGSSRTGWSTAWAAPIAGAARPSR